MGQLTRDQIMEILEMLDGVRPVGGELGQWAVEGMRCRLETMAFEILVDGMLERGRN